MVTFSKSQAAEHLLRMAKPKEREALPMGCDMKRFAVDAELPLHNDIIKWCREQWPQVKYVHANPAVKSTIQAGAQDFTIFLPKGRVLCIECKDKDGKLSEDQRIWAKEMEMNGHPVHVIRSMEQFLSLL